MLWLGTGVCLGAAGSLWALRSARRALHRYAPERVTTEVARSARAVARDVASALEEGREAMRDRELDLREHLERRLDERARRRRRSVSLLLGPPESSEPESPEP
jgi:hypothetical protein